MLVKKSLYGLKQAPKQWNCRIVQFFKSIKFFPLHNDTCIIIRKNVWIALYVDDIVIFAHDKQEIDVIVNLVRSEFDIKDLGDVKLLLGLQVEKIKRGLFNHQQTYTTQLLHDLRMTECKSVSTCENNPVLLATNFHRISILQLPREKRP